MSTFLYFAPGHTRPVTLRDLKPLGCDYAMDTSPAATSISGRSPADGATGWIFADTRTQLAYKPDHQTWRKSPGSELWIGYWDDKRPNPTHLARPNQLDGQLVEMADGNEWLVPRLRMFAGEDGFATVLPTTPDINEDGNWIVGETCDIYSGLDKIGERLFEAMVVSAADSDEKKEGEQAEPILSKPLTTEEALDIVCELLATNYYLSKVEVAMLGLLKTDATLMDAARVAMDWDTAMNWAQKKTEPHQLTIAG